MTVVSLVVIVIIAGIALALGTCGSSASIDRTPLTIVAANGTTAHLQVEIAQTPEELETGLSNRDEIPLDTGMLFVIQQRGPGFWMKDTHVALSVAFIGECGQIVDIQDMQPLSLDIHSTDQPYSFGLEVDQGWFQRNGIAVGDIVSIPKDLRPASCN
ncbi:MAG TPA: DUF192 domain-containing protein [Dehalococcoidia bacterium]|nr:DUF192 domain-containing protein [Dehalococcoidia bacterium]